MKLVICPANHAAQCFETHRPTHVLGLLSPGQDEIALPSAPLRRLELRFNDIETEQYGLVMPGEADVAKILAFAESWDGAAPMLIYCFAGISRSTASAFAIACQRHSLIAEGEIAKLLRAASASATPNSLIVAHADRLLERQGRMSAAARIIGRGQGLLEGSFELSFETYAGSISI